MFCVNGFPCKDQIEELFRMMVSVHYAYLSLPLLFFINVFACMGQVA